MSAPNTASSPRRNVVSPTKRRPKHKPVVLKDIPETPIPKPVPTFSFSSALKATPPASKSIFVVAPGSEYIRYGFAGQSNPMKVRSRVAYRRKKGQNDGNARWVRCCDFVQSHEKDDRFQEIANKIVEEKALNERRRGGGRPIPWFSTVEEGKAQDNVIDVDWAKINERPKFTEGGKTGNLNSAVVGEEVDWIAENEIVDYDVVSPIAESHIDIPRYGSGLARAALDSLFSYAILQVAPERKKEKKPIKCETHVLLVVPENATRRDIIEYCASLFRCERLSTAAVFIHHQSVTCALGAGFASGAVIDIGHTATTISCIDEGTVIPDSRVRLAYGGVNVTNAYWRLLELKGVMKDLNTSKLRRHELLNFVRASGRKICSFKTDENDKTITFTAALAQGHLRIKCGAAFSAIPAWGLFYPALFSSAEPKQAHSTYHRNAEDDNYFANLFDDLKRSTVASAALPIGTFSNDAASAKDLDTIPTPIHPTKASLSDAVVWSIDKAVEISTQNGFSKQSDLRKRLFGSILLAGGGSNIKGLSIALEKRLKEKLSKDGTLRFDVTVFDGRGKVDEELAAAAAVVKGSEKIAGLDDDGDSASLSWKGGAVIALAEATGDMWIYRDEWEARDARAVRERVPFYW